ncbi:hypothetical protein SEA_GALACTICA_68 [Streptomyces phage Galactica]|nr:hypothetical protein SEA_GALACTICA_68 [Streptomyces phage Galactica]
MFHVVGSLIECVACDGKHTGRVVSAVVPGVTYGVAWTCRNKNFGKPGNTEPQFPAEFVKAHRKDISFTDSEAIRPRS